MKIEFLLILMLVAFIPLGYCDSSEDEVDMEENSDQESDYSESDSDNNEEEKSEMESEDENQSDSDQEDSETESEHENESEDENEHENESEDEREDEDDFKKRSRKGKKRKKPKKSKKAKKGKKPKKAKKQKKSKKPKKQKRKKPKKPKKSKKPKKPKRSKRPKKTKPKPKDDPAFKLKQTAFKSLCDASRKAMKDLGDNINKYAKEVDNTKKLMEYVCKTKQKYPRECHSYATSYGYALYRVDMYKMEKAGYENLLAQTWFKPFCPDSTATVSDAITPNYYDYTQYITVTNPKDVDWDRIIKEGIAKANTANCNTVRYMVKSTIDQINQLQTTLKQFQAAVLKECKSATLPASPSKECLYEYNRLLQLTAIFYKTKYVREYTWAHPPAYINSACPAS